MSITVSEFRQIISNLPLQANLTLEKAPEEAKPSLQEYHKNTKQLEQFLKDQLDRKAPMGPEDFRNMISLFGEVHKAFRNLPDSLADLKKEHQEALDQLEAAVSGVDFSQNMTLEGVLAASQRKVVKLNSAPDYLGNASSQRFMMKITRPDGKTVDGFFSRDVKMFDFDPEGRVDLLLTTALEKHPRDHELVAFVDRIRKSAYGTTSLLMCLKSSQVEKAEAVQEELNKRFAARKRDEYEAPTRVPGYSSTNLRDLGLACADNTLTTDRLLANKNIMALLKKVRSSYSDEEAFRMSADHVQYSTKSGTGICATTGSTRTGRNVALSKVASLLGAQDLVANAIPMTAEFEGKHYRGMFMEKADGLIWPDSRVGFGQSDFTKVAEGGYDGKALKQVATLQVIDYICQNVDRHKGNLAYSFDENGKLSKIVGIDNDLSFGTHELKKSAHIQNGSSLFDIMVINRETAQRIAELDVDTLKGALSDTGLSDEEIKAAGARFQRLKDHLAKNTHNKKDIVWAKVKVVNDDEWADMKISQLGADTVNNGRQLPRENHSLFCQIKAVAEKTEAYKDLIAHDPKLRREIANAKKEQEEQKAALAAQNLKTEKTYEEGDKINLLAKRPLARHQAILAGHEEALNRTERFHRKGAEYKAMKRALVAVTKTKLTDTMTVEERLAYEKDLEKLEKAANAYIKYKVNKGLNGETAENRLNEAKAIASYVKEYRESFHQASNEKQEAEMAAAYKAYVRERNQVNRKVDAIAHALMRGAIKTAKDASPAAVEASIRESRAFERLLKSREDGLEHFAKLAKTNPQALMREYVKALKADQRSHSGAQNGPRNRPKGPARVL